MRKTKSAAVIAGLAVALSGFAYAQDWDRWGRGRDRDDRGISNDGYRDGHRQGENDRSRNRRFNYQTSEWRRGDSRYRDAYRNGYEAGYRAGAYGNNGRFPNYPNGRGYPNYPGYPSYPNSPGYPNYPGYPAGRSGSYGGQAYNQGFQDGRLDGRDVLTGHSYRPTQHGNYKDGDRGYNRVYGDKNAYKQAYRSGYMAGYEQGYRRRG
jgi:hypothetical protein